MIMFIDRSSDQQEELTHAEWLARREERLAQNKARKKKRDDYRQLHTRELHADEPHKDSTIEKLNGIQILQPIPMKKTEAEPSPIQKPTFNKILYWILLFLFIFPGYLYKKYYEVQCRKQASKKSRPIKKIQPITTNIAPFTPNELKKMYKAAAIAPHLPTPEPASAELLSPSITSSLTESKGIDFKPRRS